MLRVSASTLNAFLTCPQKVMFMRDWKTLGKPAPALENGLQAHKYMEDGTEPTSKVAKAYAEQLEILLDEFTSEGDWTVTGKEVRQELVYPIEHAGDVVIVTRVIDLILEKEDGTKVIVDYKTANRPWSVKAGPMYAKAQGLQPIIYQLPVDWKGLKDNRTYGTEMVFLVANPKGGQIIRYIPDQFDRFTLDKAIENFCISNKDVKNRGFLCKYCDFKPLCFGLEGAELNYTKRSHK